MILVIDNYDSFTYNLVQLIGEMDHEIEVIRNDKVSVDRIRELAPNKIIISPGPGRPEDAGISLDLVKELSGEIPILGICLGHQTMGAAFGAKIIKAPELIHGKVSKIINKDKGILAGIGDFEATRYHSLIIDRGTLTNNFEITAETEDGIIMAIENQEKGLYGLQFHPESIMSKTGKEIVNNFLAVKSEEI
ncbi:anthranilate synthase component II [Orenia metallireducens]|uniref:Anthranilate synthase, component II n=1 Tax=Orenia metallireducens TaxID=1413210 RepID=A0A285HAE1_9FIRM|nr:aminodeoxychorismate/anthranilate synthase component II [Orenia metallireducens]PRX28935.1 anthranilate synthase component II [Orenia metallireducens]SNY32624.1 anthranilate synthase, component II [Orenia metallireducens]